MLGIIFGIFSLSNTSYALPPAPDDMKWELVWNDECNGTALDTSKWKFFDGWGETPWRDAYYTKDNLSLEDEKLVIRSHKKNNRFETAGIFSQGLYEKKYGYFDKSHLIGGYFSYFFTMYD